MGGVVLRVARGKGHMSEALATVSERGGVRGYCTLMQTLSVGMTRLEIAATFNTGPECSVLPLPTVWTPRPC